METTFQITVSGRVQGVWFRASAREQAEKLGLRGFVRNEPNGSVFLIVTGERSSVEEMVAWCRCGPPLAKVESVDVNELETISFAGFEVRR